MTERDLFIAALRQPGPAERAAFLDRATAGDAGLRGRLAAMLADHDRLGSFLEQPAADLAAGPPDGPTVTAAAVGDGPGTSIGPFRLVEVIGEGGMGTVYLAQQQKPVKRLVALKVIKPGMDSKQVLARFEAERQALALMDHPNIAKVFDAGATAAGRSYFVMELVKGVPITAYCDQRRLTPRQRLELFVDVCHAVQHAHQKGIIHRDLKPTNVLVAQYDGKPVPKVIDFGVSKAAGAALTDKTLVTGFGTVVGTLEYMSPEQAEMNQLDVDTRSDIYSLGVLLYELLAGTTPLDRQRAQASGMLEALRIIREEEAPTPSNRLSSTDELPAIAASRGLEPAKLTRLVRGELDWIVMKALEKDRGRRYETANGFAADVERYLANEPVQACPPSAAYRLRKFVRRNRTGVLAASLVMLALVMGMIGTTVGLVRAEHHRKLAEQNERQAVNAAAAESTAKEVAQERDAETQAVLDFVDRHVFAAGTPQRLGRNVSLRQALDQAQERLADSIDQPLIEARIRMTLGISYSHLGDAQAAEAQCRRARELYTATLGPDHPKTLSSIHNLAICYAALGRHKEALKLNQETLALRQLHLPPDHPDTLKSVVSVANNYYSLHRHAESLHLREQVLQTQKDRLGPTHRDTLRAMNNVANSLAALNRHSEALAVYEETLASLVARNPDHPDVLRARMNLATILPHLGRREEAVAICQETLQRMIQKFGEDNTETLDCMMNLAAGHAQLKQFEPALDHGRRALKLMKAKRGADHPRTLMCQANVVLFLTKLGKDDEALPLLDDCVERAVGKDVEPSLVPELLVVRMRIHQQKKDAAGCRATAEMWERLESTSAHGMYLAACLRSMTAMVIREDARTPAGDAPRLAHAEADRAMTWLRKAVNAGFRNIDQIKSNGNLDAVRERPDFKQLVAGLEAAQRK